MPNSRRYNNGGKVLWSAFVNFGGQKNLPAVRQ